MIRPKNETRNLLLSLTKSCEMLIEQTHTKPQETSEFKLTKPKKKNVFVETTNLN